MTCILQLTILQTLAQVRGWQMQESKAQRDHRIIHLWGWPSKDVKIKVKVSAWRQCSSLFKTIAKLIPGSVYRLSHGTTISFSSQSRTEARVVEGFDIAPCPHRGWLDGYPVKSKGWERQELNRAKPYLSTLPIEEGTNALGYMHVHESSSLDDSYCPLSPLG